MLKRLYLSVAWLLLPFYVLFGQLITTDPVVPTVDQAVTITFDASEGTAGLANCNCNVYLHTGVITNLSTGPSDWRYVQTEWGQANTDWQLTPVPGESNKYTYTFSPDITSYYDVPGGEVIEQIALVFRNADGSLEGKATGGADIFVDVEQSSTELNTSLNGDPGTVWPLGLELPISGGATQTATLRVFDNDAEVATFNGTEFNYDLVFTTSGPHEIRLEATTVGGQTSVSSFTVEAALQVVFTAPTEAAFQANPGTELGLDMTSYIDAALSLTQNGTEIASGTTSLNETVTLPNDGFVEFIVSATYNGETTTDQVNVIIGDPEVMDPPAGFDRGITRTEDGLFLQLYAPGKNDVFVIGNMNDWEPTAATRMRRSTNGEIFWIELTNLPADEDVIFQYLVDLDLRVADPYSTLVLDRWNDPFIGENIFPDVPDYPVERTDGIVSWVRMNPPDYTWQDDDFVPVPAEELTIYELLIRDFLADHSFQSLLDTLDYLERLGITAVELMPVSEFEGNISWGYNPSFHMALDKYYGTPEDLKAVVDACHARGMSVILDVVYNHAFSQSALAQLWWDQPNFRPALDNPYLNPIPRHPFNVGYDFNHESEATKDFVKVSLAYWLEEFHIDGFRFDLSKGFTQVNSGSDDGFFAQYDASRIAILTDYADLVWSVNNNAYVILEHFAAAQEENEMAQYGNGIYFWSGFNPHDQYLEAAMGYASNLNDVLAENRGFTAGENLVAFMESHDEERMMYKNEQFGNSSGSYNVRNIPTGLDRVELASTFFYTLPGPKMLWQFGELGYGFSINQCPGGGINNNCRVDPKPIRWDYRDDEDRQDVYNTISALLALRNNYGTFHTDDLSYSLGTTAKWIHLLHPDFDAAIVGNFGVETGNVATPFPHGGVWYDYFNGGSINVSNPNAPISLAPGEFRVYLTEEIALPDPGLTTSTVEVVAPESLGMEVLPNPTTGLVQLNYEMPMAGEASVTLTDALGRTVQYFDGGFRTAGAQSVQLELNIPAGIYFLQLRAGNQLGTSRIVKE